MREGAAGRVIFSLCFGVSWSEVQHYNGLLLCHTKSLRTLNTRTSLPSFASHADMLHRREREEVKLEQEAAFRGNHNGTSVCLCTTSAKYNHNHSPAVS